MQVNFKEFSNNQEGNVVFFVNKNLEFNDALDELSNKSEGKLEKSFEISDFKGKKGEFLQIVAPNYSKYNRIIICGVGDSSSESSYIDIGGDLCGYLNNNKIQDINIHCTDQVFSSYLLLGLGLRNYTFNKYFTTKLENNIKSLASASLITTDPDAFKDHYESNYISEQLESIKLTKDLVTEPSNALNPTTYADQISELSDLGLDIEILGEDKMKELGMHSLLGVGLGSEHESKLAIIKHNGSNESDQPVSFVGKGVTFDTGGISIKPSNGMEEMKFDMAGSAVVVGLMKLLAMRKAKVNAIGAVALVENMPDGKAQNPGDVVKSMSGQTIEVINTDAEGRLVLADALWYVQSEYKPRFIIDLATLTGAIIVALGTNRTGLFTNSDQLADNILCASKSTGELSWRLPLADDFDEQINSKIADMQNAGSEREAGSITAAQFLQRFVNSTPWAHLDIAGTAWKKKEVGRHSYGATAHGVRLLDKLVNKYYE